LLVACEIHPLNNLRTLQYLKRELKLGEEHVNAWYRHWIGEGLARLEAELQSPLTGRFSHGDAPTMADCCLVPQIFNAKRYECDLAPYPAAMRVFGECMRLEAFDRAQPSRQPDAE
jgi:maleylacetoacetate isomerase/maleylpyruvate isomerase